MRVQGFEGSRARVPAVLGVLCVLVFASSVLLAQPDSAAAAPDSAAGPGYRLVESGPVGVTAKLLPRKTTKPLTVGDRFRVEVTVRQHRDQQVSDPVLEDQDRFVVTDHQSVINYDGDTLVTTHTLELAAFATGDIALPGFLVVFPSGNEALAVRSDSLALRVEPTMPEDMADVNDIKPQVQFPNLLPLWLALGAVGLAGLGLLGWRLFRRWRRKRLELAPLPDPWDEALAALAALPVGDWLGRGLVKRYYYAVSEILKRYLTRRYGFPAIDQTTSEMVLALKLARVPEREEFATFFRRADMVKYAKLVPDRAEMDSAIVAARDLVERTTPKEEGSGIQGVKGSSESRRPSDPRTPGPSNPSS